MRSTRGPAPAAPVLEAGIRSRYLSRCDEGRRAASAHEMRHRPEMEILQVRIGQWSSIRPLPSTRVSRSRARVRNETTSPSIHISVRNVSPG